MYMYALHITGYILYSYICCPAHFKSSENLMSYLSGSNIVALLPPPPNRDLPPLARRLQVLSHRVAGSNGDAITHFCASNGMDLSFCHDAHLVGEFAALTYPPLDGRYIFPTRKVGSHPMIVLFSLLVIAVSGVSLKKNQIDCVFGQEWILRCVKAYLHND